MTSTADEKAPLLLNSTADETAPPNHGTNSVDEVAEPDKQSCVGYIKKRPKTFICLGITIVILILTAAVIVPETIKALMGNYIQDIDITMQELEILEINNGVAQVRLQAVFVLNAPFELAGRTGRTVISLLIADPQNNYEPGLLGLLDLPAIETESLTVFVNVTADLEIISDRLFHVLLTDLVYNTTIVNILQGDLTVTAYVPLYSELTKTATISKAITIQAMNGLTCNLLTIEYYSSTNDVLVLQFNVTIENNAQFFASTPLKLYNENFQIYYEDQYLGQLYPGQLLIGKGVSQNTVYGHLIKTPDGTSEKAISIFLSNFIIGMSVPVAVNGTGKVDIGLNQTTTDPFSLFIELGIEGPQGLIREVWVRYEDIVLLPIRITGYPLIVNYLLFNVTITSYTLDVFAQPCNTTVATVNSATGFFLPTLSETCVPLIISPSLANTLCMQRALTAGTLQFSILNTNFNALVGDFTVTLVFDYGPVPGLLGPCQTSPIPTQTLKI